MLEFLKEFAEEFEDFIEDFWEHLSKGHAKTPKRERTIVVGGVSTAVRPAYVFAERIDNLIRILFGGSIIISAISASFLGFASLGDLVEVLIFTIWGRFLAFFIGASYLIIGLWKLLHLGKKH